jgi:hypothetical protein
MGALLLAVLFQAAAAASTTESSSPTIIDVDPATMTLRAAQAAARAALASGASNVTLRLAAGTHGLTSDGTLALGAADSHTTWEGAPGATISGGAALSPAAFSRVPATDPIYSRLGREARGAVLRADVSAHRASFTLPGPRGRNAAGYRRAGISPL